MSKLFDQLREAARMREAAAAASPEGGILSRALKRAEAERARVDEESAAPQAEPSPEELAEEEAARAIEARIQADNLAAAAERAIAKSEERAAALAKSRAQAETKAFEAANAKLEASERALHAAEERARHEAQARAMQLAAEAARSAEFQATVSRHRIMQSLDRGRRKLLLRATLGAAAFVAAVAIAWSVGRSSEPAKVWPGMKLDYQIDLTRTGAAARSSLPDPAPSK